MNVRKGELKVSPLIRTKLDVQLEAIAIMVREAARYAGGGARFSVETSRKIAYNLYEYMRDEGMLKK